MRYHTRRGETPRPFVVKRGGNIAFDTGFQVWKNAYFLSRLTFLRNKIHAGITIKAKFCLKCYKKGRKSA